uniref:Uncharacterized protein n=1 Tax=Plectus sambesii TaxID=2011161 RepID=A0A914WJA9_9BILA
MAFTVCTAEQGAIGAIAHRNPPPLGRSRQRQTQPNYRGMAPNKLGFHTTDIIIREEVSCQSWTNWEADGAARDHRRRRPRLRRTNSKNLKQTYWATATAGRHSWASTNGRVGRRRDRWSQAAFREPTSRRPPHATLSIACPAR